MIGFVFDGIDRIIPSNNYYDVFACGVSSVYSLLKRLSKTIK